MPMKPKNYYKKQPILIFAAYMIFLDTQMHKPKISERPLLNILVVAFYFFQEKFLFTQRS